ncbi:unnamed protein product [Arabidopsis lyrata]|nr:unnamed protein product [Arabidopsis lyrata]
MEKSIVKCEAIVSDEIAIRCSSRSVKCEAIVSDDVPPFLNSSPKFKSLESVKLFVGLPLDTVSDCNNVDSGRLIGSEIHGFHILQARTLSWGCLLSGFLVMLQSRKFVNKESVIIMPTFGIQLETQYLRYALSM